jgi:hypothetical protein
VGRFMPKPDEAEKPQNHDDSAKDSQPSEDDE